jgi:hypothetical protein
VKQSSNGINPALRDIDFYADSVHIRPQVAKSILGVSIATFWRLVRDGKIKTHKLTERTTTVRVSDLRAFIKSRAEG